MIKFTGTGTMPRRPKEPTRPARRLLKICALIDADGAHGRFDGGMGRFGHSLALNDPELVEGLGQNNPAYDGQDRSVTAVGLTSTGSPRSNGRNDTSGLTVEMN